MAPSILPIKVLMLTEDWCEQGSVLSLFPSYFPLKAHRIDELTNNIKRIGDRADVVVVSFGSEVFPGRSLLEKLLRTRGPRVRLLLTEADLKRQRDVVTTWGELGGEFEYWSWGAEASSDCLRLSQILPKNSSVELVFLCHSSFPQGQPGTDSHFKASILFFEPFSSFVNCLTKIEEQVLCEFAIDSVLPIYKLAPPSGLEGYFNHWRRRKDPWYRVFRWHFWLLCKRNDWSRTELFAFNLIRLDLGWTVVFADLMTQVRLLQSFLLHSGRVLRWSTRRIYSSGATLLVDSFRILVFPFMKIYWFAEYQYMTRLKRWFG